MTTRVRRARPTDRPALRALQSLLPEPEPVLIESETEQVGLCLVSTSESDRPVGYVRGLPGARCAWLVELVVAPQARRSGRASALLAHSCRQLSATHDRVRLAVRAGNEPAVACYRSLGFEHCDTRPQLYDEGTALVFERDLDTGVLPGRVD
jgi:ribosomal-protein-alanine N-acetyltransferase